MNPRTRYVQAALPGISPFLTDARTHTAFVEGGDPLLSPTSTVLFFNGASSSSFFFLSTVPSSSRAQRRSRLVGRLRSCRDASPWLASGLVTRARSRSIDVHVPDRAIRLYRACVWTREEFQLLVRETSGGRRSTHDVLDKERGEVELQSAATVLLRGLAIRSDEPAIPWWVGVPDWWPMIQ